MKIGFDLFSFPNGLFEVVILVPVPIYFLLQLKKMKIIGVVYYCYNNTISLVVIFATNLLRWRRLCYAVVISSKIVLV